MRSVISLGVIAALVTACGAQLEPNDQNPNNSPTPVEELTAPLAADSFNDALLVAIESKTAIALDTEDVVVLDGEVTLSDAVVAFTQLQITKAPLTFTGDAEVRAHGDVATAAFSGSTNGALTLNAEVSTLSAEFPLHEDFAMASAMYAMGPWLSIGLPAAASCANLTVTDNGNGSVTLDGDCTVGNVVVDFDNVTIDPGPPLTIDGTITIDDGNGNEVVIEFAANTATVFVNGTEVATVPF